VSMAFPFTVLVLDYEGNAHPRTFLLEPRMIPRLSAPVHLRADKSIVLDGESIPALCVHSGNLLRFERGEMRIERLLDQTATYLGKYLIWLRTRRLYRRTLNGPRLVLTIRPGEVLTRAEIHRSNDYFWDGYWPGVSAPSGPVAHLATINPLDDCWCWSGQKYELCCRPKELAWQFAQKLMAAVHRKLAQRS
jgi:hypothetical protein